MSTATKNKARARVHRFAGQLEGVSRMSEADRQLEDTLLQLASAQAEPGQAERVVLRAHVAACVTGAMEAVAPGERKERADELVSVVARSSCLGRAVR